MDDKTIINGECITTVLRKICGNDNVKDIFNLSLFEVYKKLIQSIMYSPSRKKIDKELPRDGDVELYEELLADFGSELKLIDLALPDKQLQLSTDTPSLRPFMFNLQRDMIEKVARYMDEILLYYDEEGQYTMFERKTEFYLRRDRRNEQRKDAYSNRLVFNRGSMHPRSNSDSKGEDDDDDENLSLFDVVSSRKGWQGLLR